MPTQETRQNIIDAADRLFYQQGFERTSFADIASDVAISRGNFYYYFKTKDAILDAVIAKRLGDRKNMLAVWEHSGATPEDRICSFIDILLVNGNKIRNYGCPIGTLSAELIKLDHAAQDGATGLFTVFRTWLRRQFERMGHAADSDRLAMHLLARTQGVATLYQAYKDEAFVADEVRQMHAWVASRAKSKNH